jgi:hypothetical protein
MTERSGDASPPLRRADILIIPLIAVATVVVMLGLGEAASRRLFVESGAETCATVRLDGVTVMRPNCTSYRKAAEGPQTTNSFNDCGYRSPDPCERNGVTTTRIALMGASTAEGFKVEYPYTFAARLSQALSRACRRPVDVQNMGVAGADLIDIYRRLDEALAMRPDLIMLALTPYEMKAPIAPERLASRDRPVAPGAAPAGEGERTLLQKSLVARISDLAYGSRLLVAAQHYLFEDRGTYVRLFMLHGDDAGYLRLPYTAGWEQRLRDFDVVLGEMADRARAAGVPMMMALVPQRIQTALLDTSVRPGGVDPYEIGRRLGEIAARHGVIFQDTLGGFAEIKDSEAHFYAVDGHVDADGHAIVATSILRPLVGAAAPFRDCVGATIAGG